MDCASKYETGMQKEQETKSFTQISEGSFTCSMSSAEQTLKEYEEGEAERKRACSAATEEPCSRVAPSSPPPSSTSISRSHEERVIGPLLQVVRTCFWIMPLRGGRAR